MLLHIEIVFQHAYCLGVVDSESAPGYIWPVDAPGSGKQRNRRRESREKNAVIAGPLSKMRIVNEGQENKGVVVFEGHDPRGIANEFIRRAVDDNNPVTPMEVQKLIYFAHGWMLGMHGRPLHYDLWEAWKYGPVLPVVYHNLSYFVSDPVTNVIQFANHPDLDDAETTIIDYIHREYRPIGAHQLSRITHTKGSPWDELNRKRWGSKVIPNELIQKYFHRKAVEARVVNG